MSRPQDHGSAAVEFTLVSLVLIPLVLGLIHVGITLHVRNTLSSAASEGARHAAREGAVLEDGRRVTRERVGQTLADGYLSEVSAGATVVDGSSGVVVRARAEVPALGLFGPSLSFEVSGRAVNEALP